MSKLPDNSVDHLKPIPWDRPFFSNIDTIVPLTTLQMSLFVLVATAVTFVSGLSIIFTKENYSRTIFYASFCFGIASLLLLLFGIFFMVSRWILLTLGTTGPDIGSVSYRQIETIVKPRLYNMFAMGLILLLISFIAYIYGLIMYIEGSILLLCCVPMITIIWIFIEFCRQ